MTDPNQAPTYPDLTPEAYRDLLAQLHGLSAEHTQLTGRLSHAESGLSHAQAAVAETNARAAQADAQRAQAEALLAQAQAHTQASAAQAQAQAQAQAVHNTSSSGARPPRPDNFKGQDGRVPIALWLIVVEQYLRVSGVAIAMWAEHVATMLAGPAQTWWAKRKIDGIADHDTWESLKAALLTDFGRPNAVRHLRDRLAACRQVGSAMRYANEFRSILVELPADEIAPQEAFDKFHRGQCPARRH